MNIKIIRFLTSNYDLVIGLVFFLAYRLFFTWLLWHGRTVPPEPDDSYYYLASAKHIFNVNTFENFRLLPFSLWLNFLSVFVHSNLEIAYKINFYIGPAIMFTALYYFVSKLEKSRLIRLLLLMIISLYSGSGDYHGFYWVVASFYQLALFFVIFAFLIGQQKTNLYKIFPACLLFIFIHPTSAFLSSIFVLYPILMLLFSKKEAIVAFKKLFPILFYLAISIFLYIFISRLYPRGSSVESFQTQAGLIKDFFSGKLNPISFPIIWREYFAIFFNNVFSMVTYFVMFAFVIYQKKYKLLAIFLSVLLLVTLSSFIPYGSRTLGFLWPVTFFIIGYFIVGTWKILQYINSQIKFRYLAIIPLLCLLALTTIFNVIAVSSQNNSKNYSWDRSCPLKLQGKNIYFTSQESKNAFLLYGNNEKYLHFLPTDEIDDFAKEGNMLVETKNEKVQPPPLSDVERIITSKITRRSTSFSVQYPVNAWTIPSAGLDTLQFVLSRNNLQMSKYLDCGHFQVSVVNKP